MSFYTEGYVIRALYDRGWRGMTASDATNILVEAGIKLSQIPLGLDEAISRATARMPKPPRQIPITETNPSRQLLPVGYQQAAE